MFIFGCTNLDTIVFNNTFSQDTIYPPLMNSETWLIDHQIAIVVPCNAYDTFYNYIHNLGAVNINLINIIPDNICDCGAYVIDTVQVYDTIQVNVTVYDTVTIHDTTITTIIDTLPVYDTTFVNQTVFVYDTTNVYDTILINEYHLIHLYDTIVIHDTVVHNIWNMYYDTTIVTVIDTSVLELYDTLVITVYDTNTIDWYDTNVIYIYETCFDTVVTTIFDTIVNYIYDTIYTTIYDTVVVFVESPLAFDELKLYPVPTRDYVTVEYTGTLNYALFNDRGKFLETGNIQYTDRLDMTRYATGTYIFKAVLDDGRIVAKKIQKVTM